MDSEERGFYVACGRQLRKYVISFDPLHLHIIKSRLHKSRVTFLKRVRKYNLLTNIVLPAAMNGVVDTDLRVYGVKNLRVVDSSAIPLISTANLQATVYAFAEKAADVIKAAWQLK